MLDDVWTTLANRLSESVEQMVAARLRAVLDKYFRSSVKVVFSEDEAAAFLSVSVETIAAWRQRGLIGYARYPVGRLRDGKDEEDAGLGRNYTYDIAELMNFRERFKVKTLAPSRYEIRAEIDLMGPELREH